MEGKGLEIMVMTVGLIFAVLLDLYINGKDDHQDESNTGALTASFM